MSGGVSFPVLIITAPGDDLIQLIQYISSHTGVSSFIDKDPGRGMRNKYLAGPLFYPGLFYNILYLRTDVD